MYNNLKYTQKLEAVGFTREQAEATVTLVVDSMDENFATKSDLISVKSELKSDIAELKSELKSDISDLRSELKTEVAELRSEMKLEFLSVRHEMKELESRMVIKLGGIMVAGMTVILAAMPFLRA